MDCVQSEEPEFYKNELQPAMAKVRDKHKLCRQVGSNNEDLIYS